MKNYKELEEFKDILDKFERDLFAPEEEKSVVVFILDKSGSMMWMKDKAIEMFNEQLRVIQTETKVNTKGCLVTFNDKVDFDIWMEDYKGIPVLTGDKYQPNGSTALYDAIGHSICLLKEGMNTDDPKLTILFVIVTDGEENFSKEFKQEMILKLTEDLQLTGRWTFVFTGCSETLLKDAKVMGLRGANVYHYAASAVGYQQGTQTLTSGMSNYVNMRNEGAWKVQNHGFYEPITKTPDQPDVVVTVTDAEERRKFFDQLSISPEGKTEDDKWKEKKE
jgi:hypothetical protein